MEENIEMTTQKLEQLTQKLEPLLWERYLNPPNHFYDCNCLAGMIFQGEDHTDEECTCEIYETTPEEIEAFEDATRRLQLEEDLTGEEIAEFVNSRGREVLHQLDYDISYQAMGDHGFAVEWEPREAATAHPVTLPAGSQEQHLIERFGEAPGGLARVLWGLLPASKRDETLDALNEEFAEARASVGLVRAKLWYWEQLVASVEWCLWDRCCLAWPRLQRGLLQAATTAMVRWLLDRFTNHSNQ